MKDIKKDYIEFGTCKKPFGIKGGFSFHLFNIEESHLKNGSEILLLPLSKESSLNELGETFKIKSINITTKVNCFFENITDRNIVEAMIPFSILFDRSKLSDLSDDEFYYEDLIGCDVVDYDDGTEIGIVLDYYESGAQVIVKIQNSREIIELPFIKQFFPEFNFEKKIIQMKKFEVFSER
jgi:16S rRNA processing protein RimM